MTLKCVTAVIGLLLFQFGFTQEQNIDALITPYVKTNNFSGSVLIAKDGKTVFSKAYGSMNRSYKLPNTPQTKFYLASVSMIFTSTAIMKLVDENKLSLDDHLSKFLPTYKYGSIITLHHLLSQRSGIPAIGQNKKVDYDSITKFGHSTDQLVRYIHDDSLLFTPGTNYNHGRSDYIVLAYIIEKVTGKSFGDYLNESIFIPLHMTNTGHAPGEKAIINNVAAGYAPKGHYEVENAYQIDWSSKTGHGSVYSTTEDLNKFANAIINNKVLSKASWEKIISDHGDQVGYGWFIRDHLEKTRFQMNGRSPGFASYFAIYPNDKLTIIVLSNNYISLPPDLGKQLASLIFKKPYTKINLSVTNVNKDDAVRFIGKYKFDENFYVPNAEMEVSFSNGKISTSWGALIPVEEGKKKSSKFILRTYWSPVEFIINSAMKVESMMYDGFKAVKIN